MADCGSDNTPGSPHYVPIPYLNTAFLEGPVAAYAAKFFYFPSKMAVYCLGNRKQPSKLQFRKYINRQGGNETWQVQRENNWLKILDKKLKI
jgi:hypothetical protein